MRTVIVSAEDFIAGRALERLTTVMTPSTVLVMTPSEGTPRRTVRITDELWAACSLAASGRGESISDVIREALSQYVAPKRQPAIIRAADCTVEPLLFDPVPGLESVAVTDGAGQVIFVGTPDDLRELGDGISAMTEEMS